MKPLWMPVSVTALLLALTGCLANPSHGDDARKLSQRLETMTGVKDVRLKYTEPITLDSGKLDLKVSMRPDASGAALTDVVTETYTAFADTHKGEEGDLEVTRGKHSLHLRSFDPKANPAAVTKAAADAAVVIAEGNIRAEINTQDVARAPHVETLFHVKVPGSSRAALLKELRELRPAHQDVANARWRFETGDEHGWLLESDKQGFPSAAQLGVFDDLSSGLPEGAVIQMYDLEFVIAQVPGDSDPAAVSAMANRHLQSLGGMKQSYYEIQDGPDLIGTMSKEQCTFDTGPVGARLERDFGQQCAEITHPEDW